MEKKDSPSEIENPKNQKHEIENYSHENISNIIGYLMDKPIFFNKTIRDNLMLFDSNFENIISICKYLEINEMILNLPDGYSTILCNNASNIDDDLKYMLSFVKILLKKSKIILLDDFFEYLSKPFQTKIWNILIALKNEHTIIMITKNTKYIIDKNVDQIILFDKNRVVSIGSHKNLYKNDDIYRKIIENI